MSDSQEARDHQTGFERSRYGNPMADLADDFIETVDIFEFFRSRHDRMGRQEGIKHRGMYGAGDGAKEASKSSTVGGYGSDPSVGRSRFGLKLTLYIIYCVSYISILSANGTLGDPGLLAVIFGLPVIPFVLVLLLVNLVLWLTTGYSLPII